MHSHDQYNTTIYGMDDRYRGVFGQRDVVFMSAKQAKICRVKNGERVNLIALTPDGKRSSRRMDRLKVVIYPMADRSLVTYFPESDHMLTLDNHDPLSGIPGYKSIPVDLNHQINSPPHFFCCHPHSKILIDYYRAICSH